MFPVISCVFAVATDLLARRSARAKASDGPIVLSSTATRVRAPRPLSPASHTTSLHSPTLKNLAIVHLAGVQAKGGKHMLWGIDPLLTADLLYALRRMGHGDE